MDKDSETDEITPQEPHSVESSEVVIGEDLEVNSEDEEFTSQHYRVKKIENLEKCINLKRVAIIASCVHEIKGLDNNTKLEELEIYQGLLREIKCINHLTHLRVLDLSFNKIKRIEGLENLVNLEKLYLSNNRISEISGLETLVNLKVLELGSNRIRSVKADCLRSLTNLEELWLGKNKISNMSDFNNLSFPKLRQISLQSNRLTEWSQMLFSTCAPSLTNVYLGSNALPDIDAHTLGSLNPDTLEELDVSCNKMTSVPHFPQPMHHLTELWLNDNVIGTTDSFTGLGSIYPALKTIYIERNPVQSKCPLDCRNSILLHASPTLEQIDASMIPKRELKVHASPDSNVKKTILKHRQ